MLESKHYALSWTKFRFMLIWLWTSSYMDSGNHMLLFWSFISRILKSIFYSHIFFQLNFSLKIIVWIGLSIESYLFIQQVKSKWTFEKFLIFVWPLIKNWEKFEIEKKINFQIRMMSIPTFPKIFSSTIKWTNKQETWSLTSSISVRW